MTPEQQAAYVMSQVACALIEMNAMIATNTERERNGWAPAYNEIAFLQLHEKYCIGHNAVLTCCQGR